MAGLGMSETPEKSLSQKSVEGTALLIVTRFLVRLIGFVSVSVTARLLTPEDFGVVGAASLVIALFAVLNQVGISEYVVRTKKIDPAELHTMWTFRVLISAGIAAAIFVTAPQVSIFLQEPRLVEILQVLCITSLLGALRAPAPEFFNRNLEYNKLLYLAAADKVIAVTATIIAAIVLRSYWALVWGQIIGMLFAIMSSQVAHPFRPRLTLEKFASLKNFALWTLLVSLNSYGIRQVDEWIAKRSSDSAAFGAYHIARDLSRLFVAEILAPAGQVFFPAVAKVQDDRAKMSEVVGRFAGAAFVATFAVGTGIAAVSTELVYVLLGYQWGAAIQFVPYVAAGTAAMIMCDLFQGLYVIDNKQNISTRFRFGRLVLIVIGCSWAATGENALVAIAKAFAVITIISVLIELVWLFAPKRHNVSLLAQIWRPAIAAFAMYQLVTHLSLTSDIPLLVLAAVKVIAGAATYIVVLGSLWFIAGRPSGGESEFLDRIRDYIR